MSTHVGAPPGPACTRAAGGACLSFSLSLALSLLLALSLSSPPPPLSGPRTFHKEEVAHHGPEALGLHYLRDLVELLVLAEGRVELPLLARVRARVRVRVCHSC